MGGMRMGYPGIGPLISVRGGGRMTGKAVGEMVDSRARGGDPIAFDPRKPRRYLSPPLLEKAPPPFSSVMTSGWRARVGMPITLASQDGLPVVAVRRDVLPER